MKIVTRARDPRREFRCVLRFAAETRARLVIGCLPVVAGRNGNRTRDLASPFFPPGKIVGGRRGATPF